MSEYAAAPMVSKPKTGTKKERTEAKVSEPSSRKGERALVESPQEAPRSRRPKALKEPEVEDAPVRTKAPPSRRPKAEADVDAEPGPALILFRATPVTLVLEFPGWRRATEDPRFERRRRKNPVTGRDEEVIVETYDPGPDVAVASDRIPRVPESPGVILPFGYGDQRSLVQFYGCVMGWSEDRFPEPTEDPRELFDTLFPSALFGGESSGVGVHAVRRDLRDRLASLTAEGWSAVMERLVSEGGVRDGRATLSKKALSTLGTQLSTLAGDARQGSEDLWLFGRA